MRIFLKCNLLDFCAGLAHAGCMRKKWPGIALVVFAFAAILIYALNRGPAEPSYEGKPVSYWIKEAYLGSSANQPQAQLEAKEAVLNIGTNGLPYYVYCLEAQDSQFKRRLISRMKLWAIRHHLKYGDFSFAPLAAEKQSYGLNAFWILQTNAAPAVPALTKLLMHNGKRANKIYSAFALAAIGQQSIGILTNALNSQNRNVQEAAAMALGAYANGSGYSYATTRSPEMKSADAACIVPVLMSRLNYTNEPVRGEVLFSLYSFCTDRSVEQIMIPIFSKFCQDPNADMRRQARGMVQLSIGGGSISAIKVLVNLLQHTNAQFRCEALDTLGYCQPYSKCTRPEIKKR